MLVERRSELNLSRRHFEDAAGPLDDPTFDRGSEIGLHNMDSCRLGLDCARQECCAQAIHLSGGDNDLTDTRGNRPLQTLQPLPGLKRNHAGGSPQAFGCLRVDAHAALRPQRPADRNRPAVTLSRTGASIAIVRQAVKKGIRSGIIGLSGIAEYSRAR